VSDKKKHLCKWDRIEDRMEELVKIVKSPEYVCKKCGRAARDKKWLCKPVALK
jgi:lipopolysaccharide biosynthesis regulator YciM